MSSVFVLDRRGKPLMPCRPARARQLLDARKAIVHRIHPFTIRLKGRVGGAVQPVSLKFDPGSKVTGMALAREGRAGTYAVWGGELHHRGQSIKKALEQRSNYRRRRRSANLRYRAPRFNNRRKPTGWLAPSLQHRVDGVTNWTRRLKRLVPIASIAVESVKFDMQKMVNPEISGIEYQQGTLQGYETREYLLEKWGRRCCYCGVQNGPLNIDHVTPKSRGGSDRVSNLVLACVPCNQRKDNRPVEEFLKKDPERLKRIRAQLLRPLKDAAAVNSTRNKILTELNQFGLPVRTGTGGQTKWNRSRLSVPKSHVLDALLVGDVEALYRWQDIKVLGIKCSGRGAYCQTDTDKYGFPRRNKKGEPIYSSGRKVYRAEDGRKFQTGVLVRAFTLRGYFIGSLNVRANGKAYINGKSRVDVSLQTIKGLKKIQILQPSDGYRYFLSPVAGTDVTGSQTNEGAK